MASAIIGWLPLYISGQIEPYEYPKERQSRFFHTLFLHKGSSCISGFFPAGELSESRWYDYIKDKKRLSVLEEQSSSMFAMSHPFLRVFPVSRGMDYEIFCREEGCAHTALFNSFPLVTLPLKILNSMLKKSTLSEEERQSARSCVKRKQKRFFSDLKEGHMHLILCTESFEEEHAVDFSAELLPIALSYTPKEYRSHVQALSDLLETEPHFHLTVLKRSPFRGIQILLFSEAVTVLRCLEPYTAFVFRNPMLTRSVEAYLQELIRDCPKDRASALKALQELLDR